MTAYLHIHAADIRGLSRQERALMFVMQRAWPCCAARGDLIDALYGDCPDGGALDPDDVIKVLISRIRRKCPSAPWLILNVWGCGYRLEMTPPAPVEAAA